MGEILAAGPAEGAAASFRAAPPIWKQESDYQVRHGLVIIPRDMETDSWGPSGVLRLLQTGKEHQVVTGLGNPYK